jgi:endonuclease/exonuclease/phosphatase family metal-dependent hydrolase
MVLTGDLNLRPRAVRRLSGLRALASARTFPAHAPVKQIDHVLLDGALPGLGRRPASGSTRTPISDHRALWVEV